MESRKAYLGKSLSEGNKQTNRQTGRQAGTAEHNLSLSQSKSGTYILRRLVKELPVQLISGRGRCRERQAGHRDPAPAADWWVWRRQSGDCDRMLFFCLFLFFFNIS